MVITAKILLHRILIFFLNTFKQGSMDSLFYAWNFTLHTLSLVVVVVVVKLKKFKNINLYLHSFNEILLREGIRHLITHIIRGRSPVLHMEPGYLEPSMGFVIQSCMTGARDIVEPHSTCLGSTRPWVQLLMPLLTPLETLWLRQFTLRHQGDSNCPSHNWIYPVLLTCITSLECSVCAI